MDSGPLASQPTQLLQHALALAPQGQEHSKDLNLALPKDDGSYDFSLDSRIIPVRPVMPRYHLLDSLESPAGKDECALTEYAQKEIRQKNGKLLAGSSDDDPAQGFASDFFHLLHGDSPAPAPIPNAIRTRSVSFHSPSTTTGLHLLSRPTKSMPISNKHYRRSSSPPSQDSFGGPVSQDPAEQYLASTKQFNMPLCDLGDTPTQQVLDSHADPGGTLPDASEHNEVLEAAMRKYDAQRANGFVSKPRTVVATPDKSGESSGASSLKHDVLSFHNDTPEFAAQESEFEFNGSSSFDKMLDRELADVPDPALEPIKEIGPRQVDGLIGSGGSCKDDILTTPPSSSKQCSSQPFEWIAPAPSEAVASSNPRSLLRLVHPGNQYRIAKMRYLAGNVEPRSCVTTGTETQPFGLEETQLCHASGSTSIALPSTQPAPRENKMSDTRSIRHRPQGEGKELEDTLDIVPDSEPLRAEQSTPQTSGHYSGVTQSPSKKPFRPLNPMSEHESGDLVPDSLEVEESETDIPLAIEAANMKRSVTDNKPRTTPATGAVKAPVLVPGNQPQRPTSSSTGRNSRRKPSRTECTEVPTSLPEQDLQGQAFSFGQSPAVSTNLSSSKKRSGLETSAPSRVRLESTTRLPATKPVAGNKRARKIDTESSEDSIYKPYADEGLVHRKKKEEEEEEEETESADNVSSPPPPPPNLKASRRKRRRAENVNLASKASSLVRNKQSATPAIATRSAKRLRSGISPVGGPTEATRVFALWKQDGHYYSGVVYSRGLKSKYLVKFDDGTDDEVEVKNMRRREVVVGDRVIVIQDNIKAVVRDVGHADSRGSFTLEADNGNGLATCTVIFKEIRVANRTIQSQWKDRMVVAGDIVTVVRPKPLIDTMPSKQSVTSTRSGKVQQELVKTGFVVTISPKNEDPVKMKDEAMRAVKQHGGLVIEDWSSVFTMRGKHSQSNKRWAATPCDFRWKAEVNLDRVFLLSDDAHQKPKFLLALALGIPCLSFDWLKREGEFTPDWQPFLLPAGYSDTLGARISQLVDLDWGNCTEHLADIMESEVPTKLFSQKTVLCVGAELVPLPPNRARKHSPEEASRYVPWIILCMGATKVEAVADAKQVSPAYMQNFDYVVVKERNVLGSVELGDKTVVGDLDWIKDCLVSSRLCNV